MGPIYPLYALAARIVIVAVIVFLIIKCILYARKNDARKRGFILLAVCVSVLFIYFSYLHGNVYTWNNNDPEQTADKISSIAVFPTEEESEDEELVEYTETDADATRPVATVYKGKSFGGSIDELLHPSVFSSKKNWLNKCVIIENEAQTIVIEPAQGVRFFAAPTGTFEFDIYIVNGNKYQSIHIVETSKYPLLQPIMITRPVHSEILDLLKNAIVYYEDINGYLMIDGTGMSC